MSLSLASAILRGTWLIDPNIAQTQLPILDGILKGQSKFESMSEDEKASIMPFTAGIIGGKILPQAATSNTQIQNGNVQKPKMVRVIPVVGVMLKYSEECGPIGTTDIARRVADAAKDPNIDAIVLKIDSPGGMVDGTQTLADAVKSSSKPVIAFIDDGMACSAAYWVASAANEIFASQETDYIGSIGVYVTLADFKKYYDAKGLPIHEIYADQSSEKNKSYKDAMTGDYSKIKKDMLNPIADKFIAAVKANRGAKINTEKADPFKGDTYMATRAIEIGLIDKIGSLESAILRAAELSDSKADLPQSTSANSSNNTMKIKLLSTQTFLASVLGVSFAQGETEKEVELTESSIATIEQKLNSDSQAILTANSEKTKAENDLAEAKAEITRLGKQAGQMGADPKTGKPEGANGGKNEVELSETDNELAQMKEKLGLK